MTPYRILIVLFFFLFFLACGGAKEEAVLKFTAIPGDNTTELAAKFKPFEKYLSEKLNVKVQYIPTADYAASVDSFVNGDVHLAWFGGLTGVRARMKVEGARAIAQGQVDPQYKTYFIAHKDSGLKPGKKFPEALRGKKFTFGSSGSTSGRLMPTYFITKFTGETVDQFFGSEHYLMGHQLK